MKLFSKSNTDWVYFLLLFFASLFAVYYSSPLANRLIFGVFLLFFWFSKKNYIWFALLFIWIEQPMGLFSGETFDDFKRIPLYSLFPGYSFSFFDLFFITAFIKALFKGKRQKYFFHRHLFVIGLFGIFILSYSFLAGIPEYYLIIIIRAVFSFSFLVSFLFLTKTKEDIIKFTRILFPFVFIVLAGQVFDLAFGLSVGDFLKGNQSILVEREIRSVSNLSEIIRPIYSPYFLLYCYLSAFYFSISGTNYFKKTYLNIIIATCLLSITLTATRTWFLVFAGMLFFYYINYSINLRNIIKTFIIPFLFLVGAYLYSPAIQVQLGNAFTRIATVEKVMEGSQKESRFSEFTPEVMKAFVRSPIIGFGFTETGYLSKNGHVGHPTMLAEGGIVEYILFLLFWIYFIRILWVSENRNDKINPYGKGLKIFAISMVGIIIIHTTNQMFGYDIVGATLKKTVFLIFFFNIADKFLKETVRFKSEMLPISK